MASRIANTDSEEQRKSKRLAENLIYMGLEGRKNSNVLLRSKRFDRYMWGNHEIRTRSERLGNKVDNKFAEIVETLLSHLTEPRPKWDFGPQEEGDIFFAHALNKVLGDVIWDFNKWGSRGEDSVLEAAASGSSHIKAGISASGWPTFTVIPAEDCAPDPKARDKKRLRFFVIFSRKHPDAITQDYGVKIHDEGEESLAKSADGTGTMQLPELSYEANANNLVENVWAMVEEASDGSAKTTDVLGQATIAEVWMTDNTMEVIPFKVDETNDEHAEMAATLQPSQVFEGENHVKHLKEHRRQLEALDPAVDRELISVLDRHIKLHEEFPQSNTRKKYPYGRVVTMCQGKLLRDEPNPFEIDWHDLFIKWDYGKSRSHYWGKPLGHDLYDPQDDLNHRGNAITQNINMLLNGYRKIRKGLFKDSAIRRITNLIGLNIEVTNHDDVDVKFGPPLPVSHFQDLARIESGMDRRSGKTEVLSGNLPKGSPAGVTVDQLIQQSNARLRLAIRHYATALEEMARIAIYLATEFMSDLEVFEILGDDNVPQKFMWGKMKDKVAITNIRIDLKSMNVSSRDRERQEAIELFNAGVYDRQAVLEALDSPKKNEILQRFSEINQLRGALEQAKQIIDNQGKQINTMMNRAQGEEGAGNVGPNQTST